MKSNFLKKNNNFTNKKQKIFDKITALHDQVDKLEEEFKKSLNKEDMIFILKNFIKLCESIKFSHNSNGIFFTIDSDNDEKSNLFVILHRKEFEINDLKINCYNNYNELLVYVSNIKKSINYLEMPIEIVNLDALKSINFNLFDRLKNEFDELNLIFS